MISKLCTLSSVLQTLYNTDCRLHLESRRLLSTLAMTRASRASTASSTPGQGTVWTSDSLVKWNIGHATKFDQSQQVWTLSRGRGCLVVWQSQLWGHRSPSLGRHRPQTLQVHLEEVVSRWMNDGIFGPEVREMNVGVGKWVHLAKES